MTETIKDAEQHHWVYKAPVPLRPYLQLARYDRPVGYWLLALPGWIGLAFAALSHGFTPMDIKWALLILIGAIAMRGAGCTYNDIVDRDLDAQVERTALRPIPVGTVSVRQAWIWLFIQCAVGLIVLLSLPRLAQIISLCAIPLVAAYPFMKRITWWPQAWLGMTFNWAVLVAYAIKTGSLSPAVGVLYVGMIFWTIGYDTIYACQDIEDDMKIGVKSTARRFGSHVKLGVALSYGMTLILLMIAIGLQASNPESNRAIALPVVIVFPLAIHLMNQVRRINPTNSQLSLQLFKSNHFAMVLLTFFIAFARVVTDFGLSFG